MLLQAAVIRRFVGRSEWRPIDARSPLPQQIADLRDADRIPGAGRKAAQLSLMMRNGLPVPDGFVVPNGLFSEDGLLGESNRSTLEAFRKQLGLKSMAVRSSGLSEDGEDHSYAGQFDTRLNVGADDLYDAVSEIYKTLHDGPAASYGNGETTGGGVIVQNMVDADFAGILFTEHPMHSGTTLVELTRGLGDKLATGTEAPDSFSFGRWSHLPHDSEEPPIDLYPLIKLGEQVERMFGHPQDIEWAYKDGRFYLLQARNITVLGRLQGNGTEQAAFERERHRLLEIAKRYAPDTVAFTQNEISELLPRPTPLSLDLMQALWKPGGSVDMACRSLGVPYDVPEDGPSLLESVFGRLYVNDPAQRERTQKGLGPISAFRLSRSAEKIEHKFTEMFLPNLLRSLLPREAMDLTTLSTPDLVTLFEDTCDQYVHETHVEVDIINIAADFFVKSAERQFQRKGLSASTYLGHGANTVVHQAMSLLQEIREGKATPDEFLELFGHRAPVDYELGQARYREDRTLMESLIRDAASAPLSSERNSAKIPDPDEPTLALAVDRARRFQTLKEEAKHISLREFTVLRRILFELDYRLDFNGDIFFLRLEEVPRMRDSENLDELRERCRERREVFELFATLDEPPASITVTDLESLRADGSEIDSKEIAGDGLKGVLVAGDTEVTGRARVLKDQNIDSVQEGEIVVARYMHPSWTPILPQLTGIVTEVGGWLSHTSILAREYNVTTITGIKKAEHRIRTGDLIRLKLDGTIEPATDGATTNAADTTHGNVASDETAAPPLAQRRAGP